jgi:hypothetical protein
VENKAKTTKAARTATGLQLDTMCAIPSSSSSSLVTVLPPSFFFTMQLECKKNTANVLSRQSFGEEEEEKKEKVDAFD